MKAKAAQAVIDPKRYCAIVFIGGGSSWHYAADIAHAATQAARQCKRDWGGVFKFDKKQKFNVVVFDMAEHSGWFSNGDGVRSMTTKEVMTPVAKIEVIA